MKNKTKYNNNNNNNNSVPSAAGGSKRASPAISVDTHGREKKGPSTIMLWKNKTGMRDAGRSGLVC